MLIKVVRGNNPKPLCRYVLDSKKQKRQQSEEIEATGKVNSVIFCRNMPGTTIEQLAHNFQLIAQLNPRVEKVVAHYSISLHPNEAGLLQDTGMASISKAMLKELGHSSCPYFAVEHHDANQKHWHVVASTVGYDGTWVDDSFERKRLRKIEQQLAHEFQLPLIESKPVIARKRLSTGEYRRKARTGELLPKEKLWTAIDDCIAPDISLLHLVVKLRARYPEISVRFKEKDGAKVGISFGIDNVAFTGKQLGTAYSFNGLTQHFGIRYTPEMSEHIDKALTLSQNDCQDLISAISEQQPDHPANALEVERYETA